MQLGDGMDSNLNLKMSKHYSLTVWLFRVCSKATAQVMLPAVQGVFSRKEAKVPGPPLHTVIAADDAQAILSFSVPTVVQVIGTRVIEDDFDNEMGKNTHKFSSSPKCANAINFGRKLELFKLSCSI